MTQGAAARPRNPVAGFGPLTAYILLYVALYGAFGVASPFWPQFYESRGLDAEQIGLVLAAAALLRLPAGPLMGRLVDRLDYPRLMLALCAVAAAGAATAFLAAHGFWPVLAITLLQAMALAPTTALADALTVSKAKPARGDRPFEYGWIRGAASAAFVLGTLSVGQLISSRYLTPIVWMNVALLLVAAAATRLLPVAATPSAPAAAAMAPGAGARGLLRLPGFRVVLVVSALIYGSHALHDGFSVIRWSHAGVESSTISILWSEAVAAEVVVFVLVGPRLIERIGPRGAMLLAAVAGIVRWSIAAATTAVWALACAQPLHGLTFALLHLACMRVMGSLIPAPLSATAQSFYAFGSGAVGAALTALSGVLYADYGSASFFAMALLCALALPVVLCGLKPGKAA